MIYKDHFLWSIDAYGLLKHVDSSAIELKNPISQEHATMASVVMSVAADKVGDEGEDESNETNAEGLLTADALAEEWKKELKVWKQGETIVIQ